MKDNKDKENLLREIERYFDCLLTDEEEMKLRNDIIHTSFSHPAIDEAKALIGFRGAQKYYTGSKITNRKFLVLRLLQTAAASLILFFVGTGMVQIFNSKPIEEMSIAGIYNEPISKDINIAMVNGRIVTSDEDILKALKENVEDFSESLAQAEEDFEQEMGLL